MTSNIDQLPANERREEPTTNDPQAGYGAEQREPPYITYDDVSHKYGAKGKEGWFVDGWTSGAADYRDAVQAKITSGELIHLEGADGTIRGDALEMRKRAKLYALSLIDGMSEADLVAMAKGGGELMVSKTVNVADLNDASYTELTGFMQDCECGATLAPPMNFCPGCGARIIE